MADRESEIVAKIASGVSGLNARAWDRLAGAEPFLSHAFLSALEDSRSVGPGTGWTPAPILVEDEAEHLVAAAPAYLKTHSQGEYVFDHGWAEAWQRAGGDYYPKLQVAVPFTPVPGARLLGSRPQQLLTAIEAVTVQHAMSSAHITFMAMRDAADNGNDLRFGGQSTALQWNRQSDDATLPEQSPTGVSLSAQLPVNTWSCVELLVNGSNSTIDAWLNGSEIAGLHEDGTPTADVDRQWLSRTNWRPSLTDLRLGWEAYGDGADTLWFDDVVVGGSRTGC